MDILEDPSGLLTVHDVSSEKYAAQWVKNIKESPSMGFTNSAYWVRVNINYALPDKQLILLELGYPHHDSVDLYVMNQNGALFNKSCGRNYPFTERDLSYRNCVFSLVMDQNNYTLYLRSKTEGSMQLRLVLWQPSSFLAAKMIESAGLFFYYGIMAVMVIYNLFLFLSTRKINYLYYVLYISFFGIWAMSFNGVTFQMLWPNSPWWAKVVIFGLNFRPVTNVSQ